MERFLHLPAAGGSRGAALAVTVLRFAVAGFFLLMAGRNLAGDAAMAADFRRWGYSDGFRVLTAVLQGAGALLLLSPRVAWLGSALLGCILVGAAWTHLRHDPPAALLAPAVFLVLVGSLLFAYRPPALR